MKEKDPDSGFDAIELICGRLSPQLDHPGAQGVRFTCQKAAHHKGSHAIALVWESEAQLLPEPPWRGEAE